MSYGRHTVVDNVSVDVEPGKVVYTHWLNERGGIEADLTVTRIDERSYWIISGAGVSHKDRNCPRRHATGQDYCCVPATA